MSNEASVIENWDDEDPEAIAAEVLQEKLVDAMIPGYVVEFDPQEATNAGAFIEDALSEQDAAESTADLVDAAGMQPPSDA